MVGSNLLVVLNCTCYHGLIPYSQRHSRKKEQDYIKISIHKKCKTLARAGIPLKIHTECIELCQNVNFGSSGNLMSFWVKISCLACLCIWVSLQVVKKFAVCIVWYLQVVFFAWSLQQAPKKSFWVLFYIVKIFAINIWKQWNPDEFLS